MTIKNKEHLINPKIDIILKKKYSKSPFHIKFHNTLIFLIKESYSRVPKNVKNMTLYIINLKTKSIIFK
jgi:hypothetical protein